MSLFLLIVDKQVVATFTTVDAAYAYANEQGLDAYEVQEIWVMVPSS